MSMGDGATAWHAGNALFSHPSFTGGQIALAYSDLNTNWPY